MARKKFKPFRFLNLPPELRDMVYELLFVPTAPIIISPGRSIDPIKGIPDDGSSNKRPCFAVERASNLLSVNKQIFVEGRKILYGKQVALKFYRHLDVVNKFMQTIGPMNQNEITKIEITLGNPYLEVFKLASLVKNTPNLTKFSLGVPAKTLNYYLHHTGAQDARLGSTLQCSNAYTFVSRGLDIVLVLHSVVIVIDLLVDYYPDPATRQKYVDLFDFTPGLTVVPSRVLGSRKGGADSTSPKPR